MQEETTSLNIPVFRRVAGATIVVAAYVIGTAALVWPRVFDASASRDRILFPSEPRAYGLLMLLGAVFLSPYILYPCLRDRFPRWLVRFTKAKHVEIISRQLLGARISPAPRTATNIESGTQ